MDAGCTRCSARIYFGDSGTNRYITDSLSVPAEYGSCRSKPILSVPARVNPLAVVLSGEELLQLHECTGALAGRVPLGGVGRG